MSFASETWKCVAVEGIEGQKAKGGKSIQVGKPTSVRMMMPKMAKKAMTIRNDMLVRSREPHVPFLLRFFAPPEDLAFFEDSFEYIFRLVDLPLG